MLRLAPVATLLVFLAPIVAGLLSTALPAFGWFPALGGREFGFGIFARLFAQPGLGTSIALTLLTGILATALSLALALAFCAAAYGTNAFARAQRFLAPLLATPHAALAIGFAFLIAPSGWIARVISPELTGWTRPPDIATVQDPLGLAFVAGLMLKETPYLLLTLTAAIGQADLARSLATARMLGYGKFTAWAKVAIPRLYPQIRLPVYAVLAFALSNVDVALILAPTNPPTLSVMIVRWISDPHLDLFMPAAAAGLLQFALVVASIGAWRLGEIAIAHAARDWLTNGERGGEGRLRNASARAALTLLFALAIAALAALAMWSVAQSWRFPDALPDRWTSAHWLREMPSLAAPATTTLLVALSATAIALMLSVLCLENEVRSGKRASKALALLYAPLLIPQVSFLIGVQTLLVRLNLDGGFAALVWAHLLFVLPYVFLALADPWRALDPRYTRIASCLGASPWRVLFAVKIPLLLRPLSVAAAVGFAVSAALYLPTLFAGGGRWTSLTTEAVTLASGGDRRVLGVYAFAQAALPLIVYAAALAVPAILFRNRKGMA
ncbi:MAG: ABC transporter permease [Tagaea sp. CACIAM 22H2]|nr:ABC transporter permease [Tagaea sp. CACIAM 22H2]